MPYSTTSRLARSGSRTEVASAKLSSLSSQLTVKFWGVRGSIPTPGESTARYGGNTPCVEVLVAKQRLIFDGGTGLRVLGDHLQTSHHTSQPPQPIETHIFFTHTQWDRIQGFPFFTPAFIPGNCFKIYGAVAPNGASIKQRLSEQMLRPNFSVPMQAMQADLEFCNLSAGSVIQLGDVLVETIGLNPTTSALGYRVSHQGRSLVYATDTNPESVDQNLLYLAKQADILIYDGTYADLAHPGAAPSDSMPWESGLELAKSARVKQLIMFHHSPRQNDSALDQLEGTLKQRCANVSLAKEGTSIAL